MKKRILIFTFCCVSTFFISGNGTVYAKQPTIPNETSMDAAPYSNNYEWVYTTVNGKLYRRLYDCTNRCWAGDWELCP